MTYYEIIKNLSRERAQEYKKEIINLYCKIIEYYAKINNCKHNIKDYLVDKINNENEASFFDNDIIFQQYICTISNLDFLPFRLQNKFYKLYTKVLTDYLYGYVDETYHWANANAIMATIVNDFLKEDLKKEIIKRYWHD